MAASSALAEEAACANPVDPASAKIPAASQNDLLERIICRSSLWFEIDRPASRGGTPPIYFFSMFQSTRRDVSRTPLRFLR